MTTDRHMEKAREMLMSLSDDRNPDTQADVTIIATALAEAEREGMRRAAKVVCSGCASGVGLNKYGLHQHRSYTFGCHASAILSEAGIAVTD